MSKSRKKKPTQQLPEEVRERLLKFLAEIPVEQYSDDWKALQIAIAMVATPSSFREGLHVYLESDYRAGEEGAYDIHEMSVKIYPGKITMRRRHSGYLSGSYSFNHTYRYIFPNDNYYEEDFKEVMDDLSCLFNGNYSEDTSGYDGHRYFWENYKITTNIKLKNEPKGEVSNGQENNRREHVLDSQERERNSRVHDDQQERKEPERGTMGEASLGLRERPAEGSNKAEDAELRVRTERERGGNNAVVDRGVGSGDVSHERSEVDSGTSGTDARGDRTSGSGGSAGLGPVQLSQSGNERSVKPSIYDPSFGANNKIVTREEALAALERIKKRFSSKNDEKHVDDELLQRTHDNDVKPNPKDPSFGANNKIVTKAQHEENLRQLREMLSRKKQS